MIVDHIGIAVRSIDEAVKPFTDLFGLALEGRAELSEDRVRIAFVDAGNTHLELLEPVGAGGPIDRFLAVRGEGIHHIAFRVDDIGQALSWAAAAGYRLIDQRPRAGARGRLIAFLHPKTTSGVLIEFVQIPSPSEIPPPRV